MTWGQKTLYSLNTEVLAVKGSFTFSVQLQLGSFLTISFSTAGKWRVDTTLPCSFFFRKIIVVTLKFTCEEAFKKKIHAQTVFYYKSFAVRLY